jgi:hypothetical protein
MSKRFLTSMIIAGGLSVGLAAMQTPQGQQQPQGREGQGQPQAITATGCVERDTTGKGDPAGTATPPAMFKLTKLELKPAAGGTGTGTGRTGTPPTELRLTTPADSKVDLAAHVGHKIEAQGTLRGRGMGTSGDPGRGTGTGTGTGTGAGTGGEQRGQGQQMMPTLVVSAVKMIDTTCK